ncbi:hypothetical protein [Paenibacillus naphthalenovorans]|uniref:hypothetical protein n=1 Tax=Paenibacillus naphthalenovorans TaxID=162209 RepID=UPI003D2AC97D
MYRSKKSSSTPTLIKPLNVREIIKAVQDEVIPFEKNLFRSEATLQASMSKLNQLWRVIRGGHYDHADPRVRVKLRETASMIATARWMYASALERKESLGMHQRDDYPSENLHTPYRLLLNGVDEIQIAPVAP